MLRTTGDDIGITILRAGGISLALFVVMLAVYHAVGRFTTAVALGGLLGIAAALVNLQSLAGAVRAVTEIDDPLLAAQKMRASYTMRLFGLAAAGVAGFLLPFTDGVACIFGLLLPRFGILLQQWILRLRHKA